MGYYEKPPFDHQALLIYAESVNSVIHHFSQLNFTRSGIEAAKAPAVATYPAVILITSRATW